MLNSENLKMDHLMKEFDHKILGLFRIKKVIPSIAMKLWIVRSWTFHLGFHDKL
jgi:hypothetical protein